MSDPFDPSTPILSDDLLKAIERTRREWEETKASPAYAEAVRAMEAFQRSYTPEMRKTAEEIARPGLVKTGPAFGTGYRFERRREEPPPRQVIINVNVTVAPPSDDLVSDPPKPREPGQPN